MGVIIKDHASRLFSPRQSQSQSQSQSVELPSMDFRSYILSNAEQSHA